MGHVDPDAAETRTPRVIHVSAHPDDEAVGCPAVLMALHQHGFAVTNVVASLGAPADRARRRAEAIAAGKVGGFRVVVLDHLVDGDPATFEADLTAAVVQMAGVLRGSLLMMSTSPHDRHPRHEAVGRATAAAAAHFGDDATWWMYAIWGPLPLPTACFPFDAESMNAAQELVSVYRGEHARNDYRRLIRGRSMAAAVLGAEQIFGFGSTNNFAEEFMELFTETGYRDGRWLAGPPRRIDPARPLAELSDRDITAWLTAPSASSLVGW